MSVMISENDFMLTIYIKDRQQVITAVLPRSQLNGLCDFVLNQLYFYHM